MIEHPEPQPRIASETTPASAVESASLPAPAPGVTEQFPWLPVLEMGDEEIDRDHREAVTEGNHLVRLLDERTDWPATLAVLRQALDRSIRHFANEDRILERTRYPGAEAHRRDHRRILDAFQAILAELEAVAAPQPRHWDRAHAPRNLLVDHCLHGDLKFKSHLMHVGEVRPAEIRIGPKRK